MPEVPRPEQEISASFDLGKQSRTDHTCGTMTTNDDQPAARAARLKRAKAFLDAGRTHIELDPVLAATPVRAETVEKMALGENGSGENGSSENEPSGDRPSTTAPEGDGRPDPTRYGDWEKNGRCIDF